MNLATTHSRAFTVAAAVTLGLWFASRWCALNVSHVSSRTDHAWTLATVWRGQLELQHISSTDPDPADIGWRVTDEQLAPQYREWRWAFAYEPHDTYWSFAIPLWIPAALTGAASALLKRRSRAKLPPL